MFGVCASTLNRKLLLNTVLDVVRKDLFGENKMASKRGALIVFEGCDRAGKSTQVKMLVEALRNMNIPTESRSFPDRTTIIGKVIDSFLAKKQELSPEAVHLLFSANRWECKDQILDKLNKGITLVVDRYAASGAAYTAATTGRSLHWCKEPDKGLPCPDIVILLKVSEESQSVRCNWGVERFEHATLQQQVASNYEKLIDSTWSVIDANRDKLLIHSEILKKVLDVITCAKDLPTEKLYEISK